MAGGAEGREADVKVRVIPVLQLLKQQATRVRTGEVRASRLGPNFVMPSFFFRQYASLS